MEYKICGRMLELTDFVFLYSVVDKDVTGTPVI